MVKHPYNLKLLKILLAFDRLKFELARKLDCGVDFVHVSIKLAVSPSLISEVQHRRLCFKLHLFIDRLLKHSLYLLNYRLVYLLVSFFGIFKAANLLHTQFEGSEFKKLGFVAYQIILRA